mmetsp:Transcript_11713/g.43654  ORF Transcript_11713/g.43654 Transcript_11713/m.43654 type:complete len:207 (+) Transcript_11713:133-753(+)
MSIMSSAMCMSSFHSASISLLPSPCGKSALCRDGNASWLSMGGSVLRSASCENVMAPPKNSSPEESSDMSIVSNSSSSESSPVAKTRASYTLPLGTSARGFMMGYNISSSSWRPGCSLMCAAGIWPASPFASGASLSSSAASSSCALFWRSCMRSSLSSYSRSRRLLRRPDLRSRRVCLSSAWAPLAGSSRPTAWVMRLVTLRHRS